MIDPFLNLKDLLGTYNANFYGFVLLSKTEVEQFNGGTLTPSHFCQKRAFYKNFTWRFDLNKRTWKEKLAKAKNDADWKGFAGY